MIALFPGSFDPITRGHEALILKALPLFERVVVAVGDNVRKHTLFPLEQRMAWVRATFAHEPKVVVDSYSALTVDYCHQHGIGCIVRGLRNETDFRYEAEQAKVNRILAPDIETLFLLSDADTEVLSSSMVRELLAFGKDVAPYLPEGVVIQK